MSESSTRRRPSGSLIRVELGLLECVDWIKNEREGHL